MRVRSLIGKHAGSVIDVPMTVAETLISQGQAERVEDDAEVDESEEDATAGEPSEHAVARRKPLKKK